METGFFRTGEVSGRLLGEGMENQTFTPSPSPSRTPGPPGEGSARAPPPCPYVARLEKRQEAAGGGQVADGDEAGSRGPPLSRGSGCAAGRGAGGEGSSSHMP